jgi:hypothetical protein
MPATKIQMSQLVDSGGDFQRNKVDLDQIAARQAVVL